MDLVRAGNDGAFEAIVARYRRPLLRYCSGVLPEGRAEDAVQQTFVSALEALRAPDAEMALKPWLYRIAHNTALNGLRDRALGHEELSEGIDGVERPEQAFERGEQLRDTVAAVRGLPERQRDAIVLRELEGRSYDEIASELGVSRGAVRQLLSRARVQLQAGMTALVPFGLLARGPWGAAGGELGAARVAELCTAGAGGAVVTKVCATALVTGAVVGGVASAPDGGPGDGRAGGAGVPIRPTRPQEAAAKGREAWAPPWAPSGRPRRTARVGAAVGVGAAATRTTPVAGAGGEAAATRTRIAPAPAAPGRARIRITPGRDQAAPGRGSRARVTLGRARAGRALGPAVRGPAAPAAPGPAARDQDSASPAPRATPARNQGRAGRAPAAAPARAATARTDAGSTQDSNAGLCTTSSLMPSGSGKNTA